MSDNVLSNLYMLIHLIHTKAIHYFWPHFIEGGASLVVQMVKNPPGSTSGSGRSPGEGNGYPLIPVFLPGKVQRSLVGCSS